MKIDDLFCIQRPFSQGNGLQMNRNGSTKGISRNIQNEHVVSIIVDDHHLMDVVCSPDHLAELVIGRLFSDRIIDGISAIERIRISHDGKTAQVVHSADYFNAEKSGQDSCDAAGATPLFCSCNSLLPTSSRSAEGLSAVQPISWRPEWVFRLADHLSSDTPMHKKTFGAHSCFLSANGELICFREDLGRHNAFDKVIGAALINGVDLSQTIIYTSGRLPVDMVTKAICAQVPILASKAVPTNLTIDLARRYNLTLICAAHPDSLIVFNDPLHCTEHKPCSQRTLFGA